MYSTPAVECVSDCLKRTDEGVIRGLYGALPLSYSATLDESRWWDSNPQPPAFKACTPNRQSVCIQWATKWWPEVALSVELRPEVIAKVGAIGVEPITDVLWRGSRPLCFSWGPTRLLPRHVANYQLDVVPAGSWACIKTFQRSKRFRRSSSFQDVVQTRQSDGQRCRWESNPLEAALQAAAVPSGSSATSVSVLARDRTWSATFAKSRAFRHTPRTFVFQHPAEELNLVRQFRGLPCAPAHPQGGVTK